MYYTLEYTELTSAIIDKDTIVFDFPAGDYSIINLYLRLDNNESSDNIDLIKIKGNNEELINVAMEFIFINIALDGGKVLSGVTTFIPLILIGGYRGGCYSKYMSASEATYDYLNIIKKKCDNVQLVVKLKNDAANAVNLKLCMSRTIKN